MKVLTNGRTYDITDLDPRQLEALVSAGFKVAVLPKQQYAVVSSFPLKTSLSLYVAIFRVYPRLRNYIAQMSLCAYPAIEICNTTRMDFMMPLSRQEEFFVPEFSEEQASAPPCLVHFTCLSNQTDLNEPDMIFTFHIFFSGVDSYHRDELEGTSRPFSAFRLAERNRFCPDLESDIQPSKK